MWYCPIPTPRLIALPVQVTAPRDSNDTQVNGGTITLASSNSSISAVCPGHHTLTGTPRFQREPLTDVLNCFGAFPLICFFRVCVCVCVCIDDLKSGRGGGRDAVIRSGPLTSLCADKAGHTLTHTHSPAMPRHQRLITHLCVITLWLLSPATTPYSYWDFFFFLFYRSKAAGGASTGRIYLKVFTGDQTRALFWWKVLLQNKIPINCKISITQITDITSRKWRWRRFSKNSNPFLQLSSFASVTHRRVIVWTRDHSSRLTM